MTYLPDVNVWIALTVAQHVHHKAARRWLDTTANDTLAFCRVTQMGFLRLLTNSRIMLRDVFTAEQAWQLLERFSRNERLVFVSEPSHLEQAWRKTATLYKTGANFWTDTYLAAFVQMGGYTLVTFDPGFRKHGRLSAQILSPET